MQRFQNKVAIITGAASGMGAETARLLASEGAKVVITDVNLEKLTTIVAQIKKAGGKAIGVKHDVSNYEDWQNVVEMAKKEFKRIDILVNNAGISFPTLLEDTSEEEWEKVMDINATSIFLSHKAVAVDYAQYNIRSNGLNQDYLISSFSPFPKYYNIQKKVLKIFTFLSLKSVSPIILNLKFVVKILV